MFPFLFILAMEGLHVALEMAQKANAFRGISIGRIEISHLIYTDDVVLLSPWSLDNAYYLVRILRCFYMDFGLKINLHKSKLIGVGVSSS